MVGNDVSSLKKVVHFIRTDIWRIRAAKLSRGKSLLITQVRIILLAVRGFAEDKCQLRASALTFYSLLSIVPVFAMAFGIAKGFGFDKRLEQELYENFSGHEEITEQVISSSTALLENTQGGLIAGMGIAILLWSIIKVLGHIERSFNDIWGISNARSLARRCSDYLSVMLICPILIIASSSITVFITTQVTLMTERIAALSFFGPLIFALLKLLPYCLIWVLFTFMYIFMPNTKVAFTSGLLGGIVAGTVYVIVQGIYIHFQVGVAKYNAIYGSFAALPMFLMWLQLSWLIVLFGAEIGFAHQNVDTYELEPDCLNVSSSRRRLLALGICQLIIKNFANGIPALTDEEISHRLEIPIRLTRQILHELVDCGIVFESIGGDKDDATYQPARDINHLTVCFVLHALDGYGSNNVPVADIKELTKLGGALHRLGEIAAQSPDNVLLKDL